MKWLGKEKIFFFNLSHTFTQSLLKVFQELYSLVKT